MELGERGLEGAAAAERTSEKRNVNLLALFIVHDILYRIVGNFH